MQVVDELTQHRPGGPTLLTIGVFDGVHRGHQQLIGETVRQARARGLRSGVVTFHPIPRMVLQPSFTVPILTLIPERVALMKALGVDVVVPLTFTVELSQLAAPEFIGLLQEHLQMVGLVLGPDFALGRGREGNVEALTALGAERGFSVDTIQQVNLGEERISSTLIRAAVTEGDVAKARRLLGRPFTVQGTVIHGQARGRTMGFPTANITPIPQKALPADGIYATLARIGDREHESATYIGTSPTFGDLTRMIEVFVLDFNGDLYGNEVSISLIDRVREDRTFENAEALAQQMQDDVAVTRRILAAYRQE